MSKQIQSLINKAIKKSNVKCSPIIITIMGDSILPHDDKIWIGMLIDMASLFHIDSRAVRTSIYRLTKDKWFTSGKQGRKSYYQLTKISKKRFASVDNHLYKAPLLTKTNWCRVLLLDRKHKNKDNLQRELGWLGFGTLAGGTYLHPNGDLETVQNIISFLKMKDSVVIMTGEETTLATPKGLQKMGAMCWDLPQLAKRFNAFIKTFTPIQEALHKNPEITPEQAFVIRTLILHEYRRVMVHCPILLAELLPKNWSGLYAYQLCSDVYKITLEKSENYMHHLAEHSAHPTSPAWDILDKRFPNLSL